MIEAATLWPTVAGLFMVGLLGAGHCVGMCGGIVAALGFAGQAQRPNLFLLLSYNSGRILSYASAGALVGALGYFGDSYLALGKPLRAIAGVLLILMGFYIMGMTRVLAWLEKGGGHFWRRIQPLGNRFLPVKSPVEGLLAGMIWGWLPCGLVYSALALASTSASPVQGALGMLAFGVGTLPAMLAGGYFSQQLKDLLQRRSLRRMMGVSLLLFGLWTLWFSIFPHQQHATGHNHLPEHAVESHQHSH